MPKRHAKRHSRRRRTQRGGDSAAYSFGAAVAPGAPYASEVIAQEACGATARPGELTGFVPSGRGGLPGMAGGARRATRRRGYMNSYMRALKKFTRRLFRKTQRGGRYSIDVGGAVDSGPNVFAPVTRLGCEGGSVNTLPAGAVPAAQAGGASIAPPAAYYAPTAGYTNQASPWVSSTGTPSLLQIPYEAHAMNPACLKTGGGRRRRRGNRKSRKSRK